MPPRKKNIPSFADENEIKKLMEQINEYNSELFKCNPQEEKFLLLISLIETSRRTLNKLIDISLGKHRISL
jgi:hypothetical protein